MEIGENLKAIKLNDGLNTIIYIDKNADAEKEIQKYMENIRNFKKIDKEKA
jgi:hypothetical protein